MAALCQKRTFKSLPRLSDEASRARQDDPDFGVLAWQRIDLDCTRVLLDDDVVSDGKAKASAFAGRLGGEKRVEHLVFHVRRNTRAVIADPDFHTIAKIFGRSSKGRLVVGDICFLSAFGRCVETI